MKNIFLLTASVFYLTSIIYYQSLYELPFIIIYVLAACNVAAFIFYGIDKLAAVKHWQRIPEKYFYLLALCFSWPGSLLGQIIFNHKTSKFSFRLRFYAMVVVNIILFAGVLFLCRETYW
jgi:uncharacterized membrane protein YsdA (DUF1294 family)